jgi:hypothetical protein
MTLRRSFVAIVMLGCLTSPCSLTGEVDPERQVVRFRAIVNQVTLENDQAVQLDATELAKSGKIGSAMLMKLKALGATKVLHVFDEHAMAGKESHIGTKSDFSE